MCGGVSLVEILFFELWAGERLELEKAVHRYWRPGRPISVWAVPFGPGTDIWRSCRFLGELVRALRTMPGGIGRFIPCDIGADHCRLRRIGWEKSRETASEDFLSELLVLFRYPPRSAAALLGGTLPLRYCAGRFASRIPTWRLPVDGHVIGLVSDDSGGMRWFWMGIVVLFLYQVFGVMLELSGLVVLVEALKESD